MRKYTFFSLIAFIVYFSIRGCLLACVKRERRE
jgi:hypothetical protein